uniref:TIGR02301 family protein n=1 Tax=Pararhizobium sp. IMCC3301 TaxID=3067904 RepID=UPI00274287FC|nr:TIGR02301 family protein [Pararhizobium sp. IMCC3301]
MISKRIRAVSFFAVCLLPVLMMSAHGQAARPGDGQPPYETDLLRLVSIIGSLEFLHPLCKRQPSGVWKAQMAGLLEAEEPVPARRARMMASYNKAYALLEQLYRTCTPAAELITQRYETEAIELTRLMATTYRPAQAVAPETAAVINDPATAPEPAPAHTD